MSLHLQLHRLDDVAFEEFDLREEHANLSELGKVFVNLRIFLRKIQKLGCTLKLADEDQLLG